MVWEGLVSYLFALDSVGFCSRKLLSSNKESWCVKLSSSTFSCTMFFVKTKEFLCFKCLYQYIYIYIISHGNVNIKAYLVCCFTFTKKILACIAGACGWPASCRRGIVSLKGCRVNNGIN